MADLIFTVQVNKDNTRPIEKNERRKCTVDVNRTKAIYTRYRPVYDPCNTGLQSTWLGIVIQTEKMIKMDLHIAARSNPSIQVGMATACPGPYWTWGNDYLPRSKPNIDETSGLSLFAKDPLYPSSQLLRGGDCVPDPANLLSPSHCQSGSAIGFRSRFCRECSTRLANACASLHWLHWALPWREEIVLAVNR